MESGQMPLVSIVIPVYNQQLSFFEDALRSALAQTYPNIEVIVSDNHSTNEIPAYLATIKDQRLKIVKPDKFLPAAQHFYFAGEQANGAYLTFLSSDDWLYPDCVETLVIPIVDKPTIGLTYGEVIAVGKDSLNDIRTCFNHKETKFRKASESLKELIKTRPFFAWLPGGFVSKDCYFYIKELHLQEAHTANDVSMLIKAHEFGDFYYADKPAGKFRVWTHAEGKKGGVSVLPYIKGIAAVCELIETSPILFSYLENGQQDMQTWRKYQSKRWAMATLTDYVTGGISAETVKQALQTIHQVLYPPTLFTQFVSLIAQKPVSWFSKPILNKLYKAYLQFQRVTKKTL